MSAELVEIRTVRDALKVSDGWEAYARRLEAHNARLQMLLFCAEVHERASETLREYAEAELAKAKEKTNA